MGKGNLSADPEPSHLSVIVRARPSFLLEVLLAWPVLCRVHTVTRQQPARQRQRQLLTSHWLPLLQQVLLQWLSASVTHLPCGLMADLNGGVGMITAALHAPCWRAQQYQRIVKKYWCFSSHSMHAAGAAAAAQPSKQLAAAR